MATLADVLTVVAPLMDELMRDNPDWLTIGVDVHRKPDGECDITLTMVEDLGMGGASVTGTTDLADAAREARERQKEQNNE